MNCYLGIDIGGTGVKLLLMDEDKNVLSRDEFRTASLNGIDSFLNIAEESLLKMKGQAKEVDITAAGIGCTGPVNVETGIVTNPFTLPGLSGECLTKPLSERLKIPVWIENDANTAHLGEAYALGSRDTGNTALITLGTGAGCSARIGYQLFAVPGGVHPEMGHISCGVDSDVRCYCGKMNCMENNLSGSALNRDAKRFFGCRPEEVFDNPNSEEKRQFCRNVTKGLFNAVTTLSGVFKSSIVILAGGMAGFYGKYVLDEVRKDLRFLEPAISPVPEVAEACLGKESGRLGAAILAQMKYSDLSGTKAEKGKRMT